MTHRVTRNKKCQVVKVRKARQGIMDKWWKDNDRNRTKEHRDRIWNMEVNE